jgi:hypothetical protein
LVLEVALVVAEQQEVVHLREVLEHLEAKEEEEELLVLQSKEVEGLMVCRPRNHYHLAHHHHVPVV